MWLTCSFILLFLYAKCYKYVYAQDSYKGMWGLFHWNEYERVGIYISTIYGLGGHGSFIVEYPYDVKITLIIKISQRKHVCFWEVFSYPSSHLRWNILNYFLDIVLLIAVLMSLLYIYVYAWKSKKKEKEEKSAITIDF